MSEMLSASISVSWAFTFSEYSRTSILFIVEAEVEKLRNFLVIIRMYSDRDGIESCSGKELDV